MFTACSTADPTPLRSSESSTSAADVAVESARPMPTPTIAIQTATKSVFEATPVLVPISRPDGDEREAGSGGQLGADELDDTI